MGQDEGGDGAWCGAVSDLPQGPGGFFLSWALLPLPHGEGQGGPGRRRQIRVSTTGSRFHLSHWSTGDLQGASPEKRHLHRPLHPGISTSPGRTCHSLRGTVGLALWACLGTPGSDTEPGPGSYSYIHEKTRFLICSFPSAGVKAAGCIVAAVS